MKRLAVLFLVLFPWTAHAQQIIQACNSSDCLQNGWNIIDLSTFARHKIVCLDPDCETGGWVQNNDDGSKSEASCVRDNCFRYGWNVTDPSTEELTDLVRCRKVRGHQSCVDHGWVTVSGPQGSDTGTFRCVRAADSISRCIAECFGDNCGENGWETVLRQPGEADVVVDEWICLGGGCFVDGTQNF